MWTVERLENEVDKVLAAQGMKREFPIRINGRLTRTLGRVRSVAGNPIGMEFSRQLLETGSDQSIFDVILHETAHVIVLLETHENHGHDAVFKAACARIGCKNDGCATEVERVVEVHDKYEIFCLNCGKVGGFSRMCKTIKELDNCYCNNCGSHHLHLVQNW